MNTTQQTKKLLIVQLHDGTKQRQFESVKAAFDYGVWLAVNLKKKPLITQVSVTK